MKRLLLALLVCLPASATFADRTPNAFASCLKEKGAVMYGAWWCPYCYVQMRIIDPVAFTQSNERMIADLARAKSDPSVTPKFYGEARDPSKRKAAPYALECANDDRSTKAECKQEGIRGYPTWKLAGQPMGDAGMKDLEELSRATGCLLPK